MLTARESALEIVQLFANCRGWLVAMGFDDSFGGGWVGPCCKHRRVCASEQIMSIVYKEAKDIYVALANACQKEGVMVCVSPKKAIMQWRGQCAGVR